MPQAIQCGACQRRIRVPDNLPTGRQFQCPACGAALMLQAPAPQPAFAFGENPAEQPVMLPLSDGPAGGGGGDDGAMDADALKSLRRGAMVHVAANGLYVFGLLMLLILYFMATSESSTSTATASGPPSRSARDAEDTGIVLGIVSILMVFSIIGNWLVALIAQGSWMAAPWRFGARGTAIAMLVVTVLVILRPSEMLIAMGPGHHGRDMEVVLGSSLLFFYLLESARLYLLGSFIHAAGRNVRRGSPPTAGAGIMAMAAPAVIFLVFIIQFFMVQSSTEGLTKGKTTTLVILNVLGIAGIVVWATICLLTLAGALGRSTRRR